jgi:hypothetical protein
VSPERFEEIVAQAEPPVAFWAQLALYLAVTGYPEGRLVIDARTAPRRRLVFRQAADTPWTRWVLARVASARAFAEAGRLPSREPGLHCLTCDRWTRCYKTEEERDEAVRLHPVWTPSPPLEPIGVSSDTRADADQGR